MFCNATIEINFYFRQQKKNEKAKKRSCVKKKNEDRKVFDEVIPKNYE